MRSASSTRAITLAISVLPTPACPSTRSGLRSCARRCSDAPMAPPPTYGSRRGGAGCGAWAQLGVDEGSGGRHAAVAQPWRRRLGCPGYRETGITRRRRICFSEATRGGRRDGFRTRLNRERVLNVCGGVEELPMRSQVWMLLAVILMGGSGALSEREQAVASISGKHLP